MSFVEKITGTHKHDKMSIHQLKNELISQILKIDNQDFLLNIQERIHKHLNPKELYSVNLAQILAHPTKDTAPTFVKFREQEKEVKSWKDLYSTVIIWVLDMHNIKALDRPIPDHYQGTKYAVANEPIHANGKHFHSEVQHGDLFIEGHGNTEHHLKTLQFIFKSFQLNSQELEIKFLGPSGSDPLIKVTFQ